MENAARVNEFIRGSWYHSLQQSQTHLVMHQVLLQRCTVFQVKIIYILRVFSIIINISFLGKWRRIIYTLSINAEIHILSMKRMSRLMKFYILLCCNVALCQKYFVCYSERYTTAELLLTNSSKLRIHTAEINSQCVNGI